MCGRSAMRAALLGERERPFQREFAIDLGVRNVLDAHQLAFDMPITRWDVALALDAFALSVRDIAGDVCLRSADESPLTEVGQQVREFLADDP
jgi:hypothetical protein